MRPEAQAVHEHFSRDAKSAVSSLRSALAELLEAVGADPTLPQEMSRRFKLNKTLTWRIARLVAEENAWEAVQHVPRRPSLQILTRALARHGADEERVDAVWRAFEDFERFTETHAGDRETLRMIAGPAATRSSAKQQESFRKLGYQANSALWGVAARVQIGFTAIAPSATPGTLDVVTVCGLIDFRRLRANVPWAMATVRHWDLPGNESRPLPGLRPIDPIDEPGGVPLVSRFCSSPLPAMSSLEVSPQSMQYRLDPGPVGKSAAATVFLGWMARAFAPTHESYPGERAEHGAVLTTPSECLVQDVFIHSSLRFAMNPSAHLYGQLPGGPRYPGPDGEAAALPPIGEVTDLGEGPPDTMTPEFTRYTEMVEYGVSRLGAGLREFHGYRMRVRYPPIPTMSILRHALLPFEGTTPT